MDTDCTNLLMTIADEIANPLWNLSEGDVLANLVSGVQTAWPSSKGGADIQPLQVDESVTFDDIGGLSDNGFGERLSMKTLKMLFEEAQRNQPSIIFFDEIDGLAPVRSSKQEQIHNSIVSTLLALMDGLDSRGQIFILGNGIRTPVKGSEVGVAVVVMATVV
ncbi:ATPase family AAA domain-containing protein [Tanacetum coccineum]